LVWLLFEVVGCHLKSQHQLREEILTLCKLMPSM
jgi:hypothetical protein